MTAAKFAAREISKLDTLTDGAQEQAPAQEEVKVHRAKLIEAIRRLKPRVEMTGTSAPARPRNHI